MNPNSQHQRWSLWQYRVYPGAFTRPTYETVKDNCARFGRLAFGSASEMRVVYATDGFGRPYWEITVRSEGHPVHDPLYSEWMNLTWTKFFKNGFGESCDVQCHARLEAGDRQDGTPADQLIMLPSLKIEGHAGG